MTGAPLLSFPSLSPVPVSSSQDGLTALDVASGSGKGDSALVCEVLSKHMQETTVSCITAYNLYTDQTLSRYICSIWSRTDFPLIRTGLLVIRTGLALSLPLIRTSQLQIMTQMKTDTPQLQLHQSLDKDEPHR